MARLTVADQNERIRRHPWLDGRALSPDEAGVHLVASRYSDQCLTHLVRWVGESARPRQRRTYHLQCGAMLWNVRVVPVEDETFVCHKCIADAERYGEPTFGMIPNTGCESSGGARWRRRK